MPNTPDPAIPPSLAALGGWLDADWFNPAILSDPEVVGFALPKLAGARAQNFHVIDRSMAAAPKATSAPAKPAKRLAGRLAPLLDGAGAMRAIACCRSKFLFESGAVLFFAEMRLTKLKARPANKLRRGLIGIGVRGCVVRVAAETATGMFWPEAEEAITAFVAAAEPDVAPHREFDAPVAGAAPAKARAVGDTGREARLVREVTALRQQVEALQRANSTVGAMEQLGLDDARLKSMLRLLHPDKHGGSEAANEAAKWLNGLRDTLKARV